jgi:peptidylprolyl isomerase
MAWEINSRAFLYIIALIMRKSRIVSGYFPVVTLIVLLLITGCRTKTLVAEPEVLREHESGILYRITSKGNGNKPAINDMVKVHYTLMLEDSTVIDSSFKRGEPASFKLGAGQVIKGWDIAMTLLAEGDEAILLIPPSLGYGDRAMGEIPANSTLLFNVKIVDVIPAPKPFDLNTRNPVRETPSGLRYTVISEGKGKKLDDGIRVKVHYSGYLEDMTMFDSSHQREQPIELTLGRGMVIKGWEEGLSYLRVGDKARIWIPYNLAYGEHGRGPIPPRANLIFDVEIVDATDQFKVVPYNVAGKDTLTTASGLKYIVVAAGRGAQPEQGNVVTVHYSGFLSDGTLFDSSIERGQPFRFVLGQGQVISGWDEGISLMQPNARYRFIIPPSLGYGFRAVGPIPENSTLIFDVELLNFE